MQQSKDYDDALAFVDAPIGETFLIIHILDGLNSEFKEIVVAVRACETSITFKELHDKLLAHAAHFVAQSNGSNIGWLMDSGASHRVTSDLQNMSLHSEYHGSDDIVIVSTFLFCGERSSNGAPLVIGRNQDGVYE
ncbi:hypothetical protein AAG906_031252 [Vitis piasezkii]